MDFGIYNLLAWTVEPSKLVSPSFVSITHSRSDSEFLFSLFSCWIRYLVLVVTKVMINTTLMICVLLNILALCFLCRRAFSDASLTLHVPDTFKMSEKWQLEEVKYMCRIFKSGQTLLIIGDDHNRHIWLTVALTINILARFWKAIWVLFGALGCQAWGSPSTWMTLFFLKVYIMMPHIFIPSWPLALQMGLAQQQIRWTRRGDMMVCIP